MSRWPYYNHIWYRVLGRTKAEFLQQLINEEWNLKTGQEEHQTQSSPPV